MERDPCGLVFAYGRAETKLNQIMKVQILGLFALAMGFAACNNDGDTASTTTDSSTTTATTTNTSTVDYAAMADSFRVNSEAGNYLSARTGKPIRIKYDVTTHRAVDETTGEPVWRYVDKRNWWVYGSDNDDWRQMGVAKMQGDKLMYQSADDTSSWVDYDVRWKADDDRMMSTMSDSSSMSTSTTDGSNGLKVDDNGNKVKDDNMKVKTSKDGDVKLKDKQTGEKVKYNADNDKIKQGH